MRDVQRGDDDIADPDADHHRQVGRRSPIGRTETGLASRDYQPQLGGPRMVTSWRLGAPPHQTGVEPEPWEIDTTEPVTVQETILSPPYVTDANFAPAYLVVCGRGCAERDDDVLRVGLSNSALSGKPYETEIEVKHTDPIPFTSPLVEVTPDRPDYVAKAWSAEPTQYELTAAGTGYLDPATNVQLWSE